MSKINDGGPAFPSVLYSHERAENWSTDGMTLRDWFAGQALAGLCANSGGPFQANALNGWDIVNCDPSHVANWCHNLADAMVERAKGGAS